MIKIYISRHGETTWNVERRVQGRSDPDLSSKGYAQRLTLLEQLEDRPISAIYTSTLQRSILTAEPIADYFGLLIQKRHELDEMDYGVWEGKQPSDFDEEARSEFKRFKANELTYRIPGGESYHDVAIRLKPFMERILWQHIGEEILIVGHRGANRMLIGMLMDYPLEKAVKIEQANIGIYLVQRNGEPKVSYTIDGEIKEGLFMEGSRIIS